MKKYIILLFATLILGFASVGKTKADCPPGWNEVEIVRPYIGECQIRIVYCYKCGVTGADPLNIKITFYGWANPDNADCIGEIPFQIVWEYVRQSFYNLCLIPPCEGLKLKVVVEFPMCKKIVRVTESFYYEVPCNIDGYYCQYTMEVCYNTITQKYESKCINFISYGDPSSCLPNIPPLPPPGYESDCYIANECKCPD